MLVALVTAGVVVVGGYSIIASQAAGFAAVFEAESGTRSGVQLVNDPTASGGQAIQFGSVESTAYPAAPPVQVCGNNDILGDGPTSAPAGAVTVPAGDNSGVNFNQQNTVYWFAPGTHTLGTDQYGQIIPGAGSTYIGAPGAIIDGQNLNRYAFTQTASNVTIRYLTIRNFGQAEGNNNQGVVNHDSGDGWTVEYNTITNNAGAGLMMGKDNTYRYNCIKDNGQYAINAFRCRDYTTFPASCGGAVTNAVVEYNEISGNNQDDWETVSPGCGCTGGIKFWDVDGAQVSNNYIHGNLSVGVWLDNNNRGFTISNNYIADNDSHAIFIEAGYDAIISNNNFLRNAYETGRTFAARSDPFPIGAIYVSENGSPSGHGLDVSPMTINDNNFENNWGGVNLWENADRYCASSAHTHPPYCTVKSGNLYDDAYCQSGTPDVLPASIDKYDCRWSTENIIIEDNAFTIDKAAIGTGCQGADYCGVSGIFSNYGSYPEFSGYTIPWRVTFQQGNIFRNNTYTGDWNFAGFQTTAPEGGRVTWEDWTAPASTVPETFTHGNRPTTFGQDQGSTYN